MDVGALRVVSSRSPDPEAVPASMEISANSVYSVETNTLTTELINSVEKQISSKTSLTTSVSLVIPAYNEELAIENSLMEAWRSLHAQTALTHVSSLIAFEILVIDDGSTDRTAEIVRYLSQQHPEIQLISQPANMGYGAALKRGFSVAKFDFVAFTDADAQFDLDEFPRLLSLTHEYDVVSGYRIERQDPEHRIFISKCYNLVVQILLGTRIRDCDCAFKIYRRSVIQHLPFESRSFFVNAEILARLNMNHVSIIEVGVTHRPRKLGESTVALRHIYPVVRDLSRFYWQTILFPESSSKINEPTKLSQMIPRWSYSRELLCGLLITICSLLILLVNLSTPLNEPDETRYAQIALEMMQTQDWVTPRLDNEPYLDKPPLLYWLTAASYHVFGENAFAARFPCAIAGALTVLVVYVAGCQLGGSYVAVCAVCSLLASGGFIFCSRYIFMDGLLTLFTTMMAVGMYLAANRPKIHGGWWWFAGVGCALGVMTKGPITPVLCLPPFIAALWLNRNMARITTLNWVTLLIPTMMLAIPWFALVASQNPDFGMHFFWKHHVQRFVQAFNHEEPFWFYIPMLGLGMFPLSCLFPHLMIFMTTRQQGDRNQRTQVMGYYLMSAGWTIGLFSLSSCKLPSYILPAIPMLALLFGEFLARVVLPDLKYCRSNFMLKQAPLRISLTLGIGACVLLLVDSRFISHTSLVIACGACLGVALMTAVAVMLTQYMQLNRRMSWSVSMVFALGFICYLQMIFVPHVSLHRSVFNAVRVAQQKYPELDVIFIDQEAHAASFMLNPRDYIRYSMNELEKSMQWIKEHPRSIIVIEPEDYDQFHAMMEGHIKLDEIDARKNVYLATVL
jgi:dolichol-phosphate mannosyltransferase